jgi:cytochrome c
MTSLRLQPCWLPVVAMMIATAAHGVELIGDPVRGKAQYESRCTACHSLDHSRIGPAHRGVFGRHAGRVGGFDYSPAVKRSHVVWNAKSLDRWLTNPEAFIPGQKMGYFVSDAKDRADIIAFLASPDAMTSDNKRSP